MRSCERAACSYAKPAAVGEDQRADNCFQHSFWPVGGLRHKTLLEPDAPWSLDGEPRLLE